jgi:hypothetical protein
MQGIVCGSGIRALPPMSIRPSSFSVTPLATGLSRFVGDFFLCVYCFVFLFVRWDRWEVLSHLLARSVDDKEAELSLRNFYYSG